MVELILSFLMWTCFVPIFYLQFVLGACNENIALAILVTASSIIVVGRQLKPLWRIPLWSLLAAWLSGLVFVFSQVSVRQPGTMFGGLWLLVIDRRTYPTDYGPYWWLANMAAFVMLSTVLLKLLTVIFYRREKDEQSV